MEKLKAFKLWIPRFNEAYNTDHFIIKLGESAGKVRYRELIDLHDSFPSLDFKDIRIVRAPEFDDFPPENCKGSEFTVGWLAINRDTLEVETYGTPILAK